VLATLPPAAPGQPVADVNGLAAGPSGSLYYTEHNAIRRITREGRVELVVTVPPPARVPSIPSTDIHPYLRGLAVDTNGIMYVADAGDARVLKIAPDGTITTLSQTESPWAATAVALHGKDVYVLEYLHTEKEIRRDWLPRVRKISPDGTSKIIMTIDQMPGAR
jgi:sugar lactone lactonase YvrE